MSCFVAFVDGSSRGNPGPAGIGVVIEGFKGCAIRIAKSIGVQDNNVAEYMALFEALRCALELDAKALHVYSDSELVVKQMIGQYTCRSVHLYSLNWTCRKLARSLEFSISHVRRENNAEADGLARSAISGTAVCSVEAGLILFEGLPECQQQMVLDQHVGRERMAAQSPTQNVTETAAKPS